MTKAYSLELDGEHYSLVGVYPSREAIEEARFFGNEKWRCRAEWSENARHNHDSPRTWQLVIINYPENGRPYKDEWRTAYLVKEWLLRNC